MPIQLKQPRRLSITVNERLYQRLLQRSNQQGRSLSNYAAFLLENALERSSASAPGAEPIRHQGIAGRESWISSGRQDALQS